MVGRLGIALRSFLLALVLTGVAGAETVAADATPPQTLVQFAAPFRLQIGKTLKYSVGCSAACDLTSSNVLRLPGRDLGPLVVDPAPLEKGQYVFLYVGLNPAAKKLLAESPARARLRTTITATEVGTGNVVTVNHTFRFKVSSGR